MWTLLGLIFIFEVGAVEAILVLRILAPAIWHRDWRRIRTLALCMLAGGCVVGAPLAAFGILVGLTVEAQRRHEWGGSEGRERETI